MRKTLILLFCIILFTSVIYAQEATSEATEDAVVVSAEPVFSVEGDGVVLDLYFNTLRQGRAGLIGLRGENIESATATLSLNTVDFFQIEGREGWWAFVAIDMGQTVRLYDLTVTIIIEGQNEPQILLTRFNVASGGFISQPVQLAPDDELLRLIEPEVEEAEFARIFEAAGTITDTTLWSENSFVPPSPNAQLTSPFGASRIFNEELETVHTGWDFNAITGTPLLATADGEVALAGAFDIRGNYVLVNHGQGVYSGYAHMSVIYVTQGQTVSEGQVLGLVGSTGRSSSAHAHFEMIVNGVWVDSVDFVQMYVP